MDGWRPLCLSRDERRVVAGSGMGWNGILRDVVSSRNWRHKRGIDAYGVRSLGRSGGVGSANNLQRDIVAMIGHQCYTRPAKALIHVQVYRHKFIEIDV